MEVKSSPEFAKQALMRMQTVLRLHVPGVRFGKPKVRFNPRVDRYHAIILVEMPQSVPEDEMLDMYDELMSAHVPEDERDHLAVLVGRQGDRS
jgi:hypothetical protein